MGEKTGIAWTNSTLNVWIGCHKVSPGCAHCYAEASTPVRVRRAQGLEVWGPKAARAETKGWEANLRRWNREALASGKRHLVFAQSLSDTFEEYNGGRVFLADGSIATDLPILRARFFAAIERCPALTFQLLTKRPENVTRMVPPSWLSAWPAHVWIGCTVEDQERADERIPYLLRVPAPVCFLSVEPQIEAVEIRYAFGQYIDTHGNWRAGTGVSWVICGGESGPKARPFDLAWARSLRDQCRAAGVALFLKQLGARPWDDGNLLRGGDDGINDSHGTDESEWPADLRGCRAFPEAADHG